MSAPVTDFWWLLQFSQAAVYCLVMTSTGHRALTDYTCTQFAFILLLLSEVVVHTVNFIYLVSMPIRSKRLHRVSLLSAGACNGVHLKLQHSVRGDVPRDPGTGSRLDDAYLSICCPLSGATVCSHRATHPRPNTAVPGHLLLIAL